MPTGQCSLGRSPARAGRQQGLGLRLRVLGKRRLCAGLCAKRGLRGLAAKRISLISKRKICNLKALDIGMGVCRGKKIREEGI